MMDELARFGLSAEQMLQLRRHFDLLERWNKRVNLTSIKSPEEIVRRHYAEALLLAGQLAPGPARVADVGSGAGFPGIPVAVARPDLEVTLVESRGKKAVFLKEAARGMPNVRVLTARAEDLKEQFDWIISRAVRPVDVVRLLPSLARQAALLVGAADAQALQQLPAFHWTHTLPVPDSDRRLLLVGEWYEGMNRSGAALQDA